MLQARMWSSSWWCVVIEERDKEDKMEMERGIGRIEG
jgi:hypothetical protein